MIEIIGTFYDGQSSVAHSAKISIQDDIAYLFIDDAKPVMLKINDIIFDDPIGNITRIVSWEKDGVEVSFQTDNIAEFDQWYKSVHSNNAASFIHFFEKNIYIVIAALLLSIVLVFLYVTQGVPAMSRAIAKQVPPSVYSYTSDRSMTLFDKVLFDPSELSNDDKVRIEQKFYKMVGKLDSEFKFDLQFRAMGKGGDMPNAFALPSGIIVITDGLVNIADNDEQILAVLGHEIGHVTNMHGMTKVVQASLLVVSAAFIVGDLSGVSEVLINNSIVLTELSYGRELEKEADVYGAKLIKQQGIGNASLLIDILEKMSAYYGIKSGEEDNNYFSSHPLTSERKEYLLEK